MTAYVPTLAELESALKHLHDPDTLRRSPLATLEGVHRRVERDQRVSDYSLLPLPWIYGYELAALIRERIEQLHAAPPRERGVARQSTTTRAQLYTQILKLRFLDGYTWNEVAATIGLASGHIQNKLKRPAIQYLLGNLLNHDRTPTPVATPLSTYPTNLPPPGEFIGRHAEIAQLLAKLRQRRMPIIEISGIGGVGKSALAKHMGWRAIEEQMFDAVIWLSAKQQYLPVTSGRPSNAREALRSLNDLFETLVRVLGASHVSIEPGERRRQALDLLTSGRFPQGVLIILDNYEALQDEEQERITAFLFEELPYPSQALITSRHEEHLLMVQSHVLPIKVHLERMSVEDARECLDYFLSLQSPPLVLSEEVRDQIIGVGDRIPLAMLWLLGQLRYSPRSPFETLRIHGDGSGQPHALLSYIFDYSYTLLKKCPDAPTVLQALTVLSEPITFEPLTATAALPPSAVEQVLLLLQQLSLVLREGGAAPRYGLLELTRTYVTGQMRADQRAALLQRAAEYYADHGTQDDRSIITPLLEWAIKEGQHSLVIRLFDVLTQRQFIESDTQVRDCATYGPDAVQSARVLGEEQRADWYELFAVSWIMVARRDSGARALLERLLDRAERHGWQMNSALACSTLGLLFNDLGAANPAQAHTFFTSAAAYLNRAAQLWEELGRHDWLAVVLGRLGTVTRQIGDYERALAYFEQTESIFAAIGSHAGQASALGRHGYTLLDRYRSHGEGDPHLIEALLLEALRQSEQIGNQWGMAANSLRYAEFLVSRGDPAQATIYAERALALFETIPEPARAEHARTLLSYLRMGAAGTASA